MGEECKHCKKWKEHCRKFEEHFYWDHVDVKRMHFSKFMTEDFSNCMVIPKKFIDHFTGELLETIELKVPSGDIWHVELKKTYDGVVLECGWKSFVEANGIQENDMLVFKYDGSSSFFVLMFEQNGCEKAASHCAKRRDPMNDLFLTPTGKKLRHSCYGSSHIYTEQAPPPLVDHVPSRAKRNTEERHGRQKSSSKRTYRRKSLFTNSRKKRPANEQEIMMDYDTENTSIGISLDKRCNPKDFFISSKRRLNDAENVSVLSLVETVQTDKPSFISIMVPCSVSKRFFLTIPIAFAVEYLPRVSRRILLQLPDKKRSWPVGCLVQGHSVGFSSGWREFADDNMLKVGDVCLFELIELHKGILMVVHFNRVEQTLPPMTPAN